LIQQGLIDQTGGGTGRSISYAKGQGDMTEERLLPAPLVLDGEGRGSVLVAQSVDSYVQTQVDIQNVLIGFAGVIAVTSVIFAALTLVNFARPLTTLANAAEEVSHGNLNERVNFNPGILGHDEISD